MPDSIRNWETVFGYNPSDAAQIAHEAAFYAEYPAELADDLAADFREYLTRNDVPIIKIDVSPLGNCETFWSLFKSLLPACPIDAEPFLQFRSVADQECPESYRIALAAVRVQIALFGHWLESTDLWSKRPPKDSRGHDTQSESTLPEDPELRLPAPAGMPIVDSDYAEPLWKSQVAFLLGISVATVPRWIERGDLSVMPGTRPNARKIRVLNECFPHGMKRTHERQKKLSGR